MSAKSADIKNLQSAVRNIDALAREGLSEIAAIAKLALAAMESPTNHPSMEILAQTFSLIWAKAENIENNIGCEAEEVGCAHVDDAALRRYDAFLASQKGA